MHKCYDIHIVVYLIKNIIYSKSTSVFYFLWIFWSVIFSTFISIFVSILELWYYSLQVTFITLTLLFTIPRFSCSTASTSIKTPAPLHHKCISQSKIISRIVCLTNKNYCSYSTGLKRSEEYCVCVLGLNEEKMNIKICIAAWGFNNFE